MNPIRVLHICQRDDLRQGGAYKVALDLALEFQSMPEVESLMVFLYGEPGFAHSQKGLSLEYLGLNSSNEFWKYSRLYQLIRKWKPDVIHDHQGVLWSRLITSIQKSVPVVTHAHLSAAFDGKTWNSKLSMYLASKSDKIIGITNETAESWRSKFNISKSNIAVVNNGIRLSSFRPAEKSKSQTLSELHIPQNKKIAGSVGRLVEKTKGISDFIRLISKLPDDWIGIIAGDGEDRKNLEKLCSDYHLENRIFFIGNQPDIRSIYRLFDVLCFTSHHEEFGLVIIEAQSLEIPVIGFKAVGGVNEILSNETGLIIQNRDIDRMVEAILMLENPAEAIEWEKKIKFAKQLCEKKYDWKLNSKKILDIYQSL